MPKSRRSPAPSQSLDAQAGAAETAQTSESAADRTPVEQVQSARGNQAAQQTMNQKAGRPGGFALDADVAERLATQLGGGDAGDGDEAVGNMVRSVVVHTDKEAEARATSMGARAFAEGNDIFFARGEYLPTSPEGWELLAHEVTHVVQQGGGRVGSVSSPADASEQEARNVASGDQQGDVRATAGAAVQRDSVSELNDLSDGNWIGDVDEAECLRRVHAMSDAERQTLTTRNDIMRRLCGAFNGEEMFELIRLLPLDIRWQVYWLVVAGEVDSLSEAQWGTLVAEAEDSGFQSLRSYPTGWQAFLRNAPLNCLPPIERLNILAEGNWIGDVDVAACLSTLAALSEAQKAEVRGRSDILNRLSEAFDAAGMFQCVRTLNMGLIESIRWIDNAGAAGDLSEAQWSILLLEASPAEFTDLTRNEAAWTTVRSNVGASRIALLRGYRDPQLITAFLGDASLVDLMITNMGPLPVFEAATAEGASATANYDALHGIGKIDVLLDALPRGSGLSDEQKSGLKKWFRHCVGGNLSRGQKMMGIRFNFQCGDDGTRAGVHNDASTTLQAWTPDLLIASWDRLEQLPPAHVEGNDELDYFLRKNDGSSYYWGHDDSIAMGHSNLTDTNRDYFLATGDEQAAGTSFEYNTFNAHLRHEIGHAVDAKLGLSQPGGYVCTNPGAGQWVQYADGTAWLNSLLEAGGGITGDHADHWQAAAQRAVAQDEDLAVALQALKDAATVPDDVPLPPDAGPLAAVYLTQRWTSGANPWDTNAWRTVGSRNWHRAYSGSRWVSFLPGAWGKRVSNYQFRAPGEWFAELYAAYYADLDEGSEPGGRLRGRDATNAAWMDGFIDQGYSLAAETNQGGRSNDQSAGEGGGDTG